MSGPDVVADNTSEPGLEPASVSTPASVSPLDRLTIITTFADVRALTKDVAHTTLREFAVQLRDARAPTRDELKLFSPGNYGSKRTAAKSLRHDNNIIGLFDVIGDYDNGRTSIAEAVAAAAAANLCCVIATTGNHTSAAPRFRVICPLADPLNRARANATGFELAEYHKLASRLAGVFPDGLAPESWNRSQGWFIGCPDGAPDHQVVLIDGLCIDQLSYLDQTAVPRPPPPTRVRAPRGITRRRAEPIPIDVVSEAGAGALAGGAESFASQTLIPDDALLLDIQASLTAIAAGENSHNALVALCGKFAAEGLPEATATAMLTFAADQRPAERQDAGWKKMRADIARTVRWAYDKEAAATTPTASGSTALVPVPVPSGSNGATPPPSPPGKPPPPPPGPGATPPPGGPQPQPNPGMPRGMMRSRNSKFSGNLANVMTCLLERPELIGCVAFDQMALAVSLQRGLPGGLALPAPRPLTDADVSQVQDYLQRVCLMGRVGRETVQQGIAAVAHANAFHPVRTYLDGLVWDSVKRIDTWLPDYLSVEPSDYARATGRMWLIGLTARIQRPGCKFDYMLVLEGLQGTYKSQVCNALCGPWVSDQALDIRNDSRAASQHLRNVWLVEISELTLFKRPEGVELLKAFLARSSEKYLARYAAHEIIEPRQCGFIGSTNQSNYLHDATGNRRIWPHLTGNIRLRGLMRDRDQIWAEVMVAYRAGEHWWPDRDFEKRVIQPQQTARYYADAWLEPIGAELTRLQGVAAKERARGLPWANARARSSLLQIWQAAMAEPGMVVSNDATRLKFDRSAQLRVREILQFLGWQPSKLLHGRTQWEEPL